MSNSQKSNKTYFLEDSNGQTLRAINWEKGDLHFVFLNETKRIEAITNLSALSKAKIDYKLLETIDRKQLLKTDKYPLKFFGHAINLVTEPVEVIKNIELPEDQPEYFYNLLKKTSITGLAIVSILFVISFFIKTDSHKTEEEKNLQIVKVLDRKQIAVPVVAPATHKVKKTAKIQKIVRKPRVKKLITRKSKRTYVAKKQNVRTPKISQMGALGALGNVQGSNHKGGLKLNQAQVSNGIGRGGGTGGSGGVQKTIYSKGLFAAPLGSGNNINGAGGYGNYRTKGKGGGKGGYGKLAIVGDSSSSSMIMPLESEAWTEGGLDRNAIAAVIQRHLSEVRYCYESGLQKKPNLSGRVSMKFMIGPNGSVRTAQVSQSSLGHRPVENCIRDHLKTWKFPEPEGGVNVKVSYPFVLRKVSDS
ncbi:MAG: energy transducer TonB [Bdellovibrionales bacterium]|nr:energy transducer TonB [Bdellovibrionales bacterium]